MSKIDYEKKSRVLNTDLCKRVSAIDKQTFLNFQEGILNDYALDAKAFDLMLQYGADYVEEARKINKASYKRVKRLRKRVLHMLNKGACIFCTFNFSDEVLAATSQDTRRQYVRKYLKQFNCMYIANIDFGSNDEYIDRKGNKRIATSREHYHALVCCDRLPLNWSYGYQWLEKVDQDRYKDSDERLSKYVSKLSNHAIKETTKRSALIYSRM